MFIAAATLFSILAISVSAAPATIQKRAIDVVRTCNVPGQVALTFDDGPYQWNGDIRNNMNGGKATFFVNGQNYGCIYDYADQLKEAYAAGHTIGNHGWSHKHMAELSWDEVHDELYRVEEAMVKILGVKPKYFRPPYGEYNDNVLAALDNRGYTKLVLWSDDTNDANGAPVWEGQGVFDRVASSYPNPANILMHETVGSTPFELVPSAVQKLQSAGYELVATDVCLGDQGEWPYIYVGEPQQRDASWQC